MRKKETVIIITGRNSKDQDGNSGSSQAFCCCSRVEQSFMGQSVCLFTSAHQNYSAVH